MSTSRSRYGKTSTAAKLGAKSLPPAATKRGRLPHFLAEISEVAALEALRANAKAVELLTGRHWYVMTSAREAGPTWAQIGEALGITKQAAHDFYSRKIEKQEKYLTDLHDTAAARAVLDE